MGGATTDSTDMATAEASSAVLTTGAPTPAVLTLTAGLTTSAFVAWTEPATSKPQIRDSTGLISVMMFALAAKIIAPPATGRMTL